MANRRPDSSSPQPHEHVVDVQVQAVRLRRTPRYGRILGLGVAIGIVLAVILTAVSSASGQGVASSGEAGLLWAFGLNALVTVALSLLISALIILAVDRSHASRLRAARAAQEVTLVDDLTSPMTDQVPPWRREQP